MVIAGVARRPCSLPETCACRWKRYLAFGVCRPPDKATDEEAVGAILARHAADKTFGGCCTRRKSGAALANFSAKRTDIGHMFEQASSLPCRQDAATRSKNPAACLCLLAAEGSSHNVLILLLVDRAGGVDNPLSGRDWSSKSYQPERAHKGPLLLTDHRMLNHTELETSKLVESLSLVDVVLRFAYQQRVSRNSP